MYRTGGVTSNAFDPNSQYIQWPHELDRECEDDDDCEPQGPDGCDDGAKQMAQYCVSKDAVIETEDDPSRSVRHELQCSAPANKQAVVSACPVVTQLSVLVCGRERGERETLHQKSPRPFPLEIAVRTTLYLEM
jgi:hypothetical protein